MEQLQTVPASLPHIVQVYQPSVSIHPSLHTQGKLAYQEAVTSEALHPVTQVNIQTNIQNVLTQNQTVMSCQQIHLRNVHQTIQAPIHSMQSDCQPLQIASHVILPQMPVYKQHMLTGTVHQQYFGQYEAFLKEQHCIVTKIEPELPLLVKKDLEKKLESNDSKVKKKMKRERKRNIHPKPSEWASNIRKQRHQRGEAYVSRRGKYVPERSVKNMKDCLKTCRYKCNERISDSDRQSIFKAFYSLNVNEKKHFLLNTTERISVRHNKEQSKRNFKRNYSFKYFFLVRADRHSVCKKFYLGTLAISQKPVYNVHLNKSDVNLPKPDGRGLSESSVRSLPDDLKQRVRKHIMSFNTIDGKPITQFSTKKQYLEAYLNIKQMYTMYCSECEIDGVLPVKESMYRKIFKEEFNLHFKKVKSQQICCKCKGPVKNDDKA